ncbi:hypothetical protein EDB85DRAFT_2290443, partial [Lactarius pseudohatsudake]
KTCEHTKRPIGTVSLTTESEKEQEDILSRPLFTRCSTSLAFQVAVDHAFTGSYAKRFRRHDPPSSVTCPCGWGLRDPPHLISSCLRYFHHRIDSGVSGQGQAPHDLHSTVSRWLPAGARPSPRERRTPAQCAIGT